MLEREVSREFKNLLKQGHIHHTHWKKDDWDTFLIMSPLVWKQVMFAIGLGEKRIGELLKFTMITQGGLKKRLDTMVECDVLQKTQKDMPGKMGGMVLASYYSIKWLNLRRFVAGTQFSEYVDLDMESVRRMVYNRLEPQIKLLVEQLYNNNIVKLEMRENIDPYIAAFFGLIDETHTSNYEDEDEPNDY